MICSSCGTENEQGRKFCGNCGTALSVVPGVTFTVSQTAHGTVERFTLD